MTRAKGKVRRAMPDSKNENENETESVGFYNVFDGTKGRTESIYLDIQERIQAEKVRARLEGREPNLDDEGALPAAVGTPLVIDEQRVDNRYSNPSVDVTGHKDVDPVVELDVDKSDADVRVDLSAAAQVARERQAEDKALGNETAKGDSGNESVTLPAKKAGPSLTTSTTKP